MAVSFKQPSVVLCTETDVQGLLSTEMEQAQLDDAGVGPGDADQQARISQAIAWGSSKVLACLQPLYDSTDLTTSALVNEWATIASAYWLCSRRGNPVPESVQRMWLGTPGTDDKGALGDLIAARKMELQIPDIGYRNPEWPAWSNVRVDPRYRTRQIRVERPISEQTPTQYSQNIDWPSEFSFEI